MQGTVQIVIFRTERIGRRDAKRAVCVIVPAEQPQLRKRNGNLDRDFRLINLHQVFGHITDGHDGLFTVITDIDERAELTGRGRLQIRVPNTDVGRLGLRKRNIRGRLIILHTDIKVLGAEIHLIIIFKAFFRRRRRGLTLADVFTVYRDPVLGPEALVECAVNRRPNERIIFLKIPRLAVINHSRSTAAAAVQTGRCRSVLYCRPERHPSINLLTIFQTAESRQRNGNFESGVVAARLMLNDNLLSQGRIPRRGRAAVCIRIGVCIGKDIIPL